MNKNAVATLPITASVANQNFIFLVLAWICGIIVWFNPGVGVWFLLPVFLLWIVRGIKTHQFIQSSLLNLPGAVFMLTAIIGVWTAYDFQAAFHKFLILLAGIFIYIALAYLDQERIFWFFGLVSVTALLLAGYFLLSNDWAAIPADFDLINRLAERWMAVRAGLPPGFDNANIPAGILAVMLPLIAAFTWYAQANLRHHWRWIGWVSFSVVYFAIFMSSSRAVWMALAAGLAGWAWWEISNRAGHRLGWNPRKLFLMGISIVVAAGVFLLSYQASQFNSVASVLTGGSSAFIRSNLYHQTTDLIADFWLTGGGLQSFAGLYSKYILDIPYLFFKYAHNLWLDVALEQGLFGLLSFVAIYAWTSIQLLHFIVRSSQDLK
ncbi:MAG TPA: O-antigen ligase family protein, partial [Anaerolineales bacterium]|nr:O-antigen ligase family protein [Anaerolineales bacterium]